MSKNMINILTDVAENVQAQIEKGNTQISVFTGTTRIPIINNYALLFNTAFLQTIDDYDLTRNDIRVMLKIIELMRFGNLVHMSWTKVAIDLNIKPTNITRHLNKLKKSKLIIDDGGNLYLNPQIIAKGKFLQKGDDNLEELLDKGAEALEGTNVKPSIITPKMREKMQNEQINFLRSN